MEQLQNDIFRVEVTPENGEFSIITRDQALPNLLNCRIGFEYTLGHKKAAITARAFSLKGTSRGIERFPAHGDVDILHFDFDADDNGIAVTLDVGIVQEYPLIIWKIRLINQGSQVVKIVKIRMLDIAPGKARVEFSQAKRTSEMGFFSNGWQSWSPTQWYPADEEMQVSKLGRLQLPMIKYAGTPLTRRKSFFSSDFFAALGDRKARNGFVVGFLSQKEQFGSITCHFGRSITLSMWANGDETRLDPGRTFTTDWAVFNPIQLDHRDPMGKYIEAVARENEVKLPSDVPVGWCSWYQFYAKVAAEDIEKNMQFVLDKQEELPVQLIQIDDGFETQVGDWFTFKNTFKQGMKSLADKIFQEGLIPGLWLAPFAVHPKSKLMKEHPDWILRNKRGKPVNAGYGWGTLFTGLDLTVPDALAYAVSTVRIASQEWGYPYLKLDFLYTAALEGQYSDETLTRAQVMRRGMQAIRDAVGPNVFLLGCGAPLGSVIGLVDANRIGPDVSGEWAPHPFGNLAKMSNEYSVPCARNSIRNIITRANLNRQWWVNDPDCLLIRAKMGLKLEEVRSLASVIALSGGSLLLSDNLPDLPVERMRIAESLIPPIGERARVIDWFDHKMPEKMRLDLLNETGEWHALGAFNWDEVPNDFKLAPASFGLDDKEYWLCEFWSGHIRKFNSAKPVVYRKIAAHGGLVLSARLVDNDHAIYLGSDFHISQGLEVADWKEDEHGVVFTLRLPRIATGNVVLAVPRPVEHVIVNGSMIEPKQVNNLILQIPLRIEGFAQVEVKYGAQLHPESDSVPIGG